MAVTPPGPPDPDPDLPTELTQLGEEDDAVTSAALAAAVDAARAEESDWPEVAATIKTRLRSVVVPSRPVLAWDPSGRRLLDEKGRQDTVASRDLVVELRRRLSTADFVAADVDLEIAEKRLARVDVDLVGRYGVALREVLDTAWAVVERTVVEHVGRDPDFTASSDVRVRVVDVVDGDPGLH